MHKLHEVNRTNNKGTNRRGVAPIIATLLMVAIAVVGGILIFTFANGFFENTGDIGATKTESIQVVGSDTRDLDNLKTHNGTSLTAVNPAANPDNQLTDADDAIVLYVKNKGGSPVQLKAVNINGDSHLFDGATGTISGTAGTQIPADGKFVVSEGKITPTGDNIIEAGETVTVVIRYDGEGGNMALGRNLKVELVSVNDQGSLAVISVGERDI